MGHSDEIFKFLPRIPGYFYFSYEATKIPSSKNIYFGHFAICLEHSVFLGFTFFLCLHNAKISTEHLSTWYCLK